MALRVSRLKPNSRKMKNIDKGIFKKTERDRDKSKKEIERKSRYARKAKDSEKHWKQKNWEK